MSRFTGRDLMTMAGMLVCAVAVFALAAAGQTQWAIATLGVLALAIGVAVRLQFIYRRTQATNQTATIAASKESTDALGAEVSEVSRKLHHVRREVAGLRDELQQLNRGIEPNRADHSTQAATTTELSETDAPVAKKAVGLVGFFGHGNYGDELFIDVFQQFLGRDFDLRIIPDLESKPYFSRPVEEKVDEVEAIVLGGGDLVQQWSTDPRYFDRTYLRKPLFVAGVGVPIYGDSEKHKEKPHIINRLRRFFQDPNVKLIGMRDDFGANWIREKLEPTAPVTSEPDIVCSLKLPEVSKPAGQPILGIVTRQRRVETPDDYTRLEELAAHAQSRGFRIRHIILGTGSVGERDIANAPALNVPDKEVIHSEDLDALSRAIGECTVLASMKFHGTVVATMYGVPSIVLVPTNKNRNFMARIGRSELVASHNSDRLIEIFGMSGPAPIDPDQVAMLRARSTAFMEELRDQLIEIVD
ncbi:polysaccharide pyruvyl transferase family protein [Microbacterium sp. NC79]|uniref:polysaccharide pyruvyl transferase family protein n=1 Tax=Microbacterium sp. NC79 TaxID=2851009 RepID=UPI001C2B8934|nr:polysaccharide pyruvyl transferase family protein [Microbacterium sp. NC79]MBV0894069.1 polysaccharide pyruvyl transferase family protein [Microbacterium sp. NC79]